MAGKASIVFAHGRWADGSCFNKLIPTLQAEGHEVFASQHGLNSLESDVACVNFTIDHVPGPVVLVGHSYGGTLITKAGTNDLVRGAGVHRRARPRRGRDVSKSRTSSPVRPSSSTSRSPGGSG